ncbi:ATP synthase F0 subunit A [Niastella yeongjuensis]|uniref:ATP synthase subunit a n=1 Tax=Niastella yeongjuensis TaxID=354355 RepID=A0A1V9EY23_9BACT|nr:F0F1 ATP synthase subunit A [Niastella yeongjuensis]OQP50946.1 ATP synthase F0 subunit A [Niastella yeongjuensis]SEN10140.1 F-type H+-transporting ATPase subunit a [Niastella yeongjuensis]
MLVRSVKSLLVAVFSLSVVLSPLFVKAEDGEAPKEEKLNPAKLIIEHVSDGHEYHFVTVGNHPVSLALPVILYSPEKGFTAFMSSAFHHGTEAHEGYILLTEEYLKEHKELEEEKDEAGKSVYKMNKIYALDAEGKPSLTAKVYDFSLTRNATQMLISVILLIWLMTSIAKKYKKGIGETSAPKGFQNAVEPVITFVRDDVAKANLGHNYEKYMPLLLSVFFFILINNLIGLIPGTANVTGNISFTAMLGLVAFIVILFSTNKHFWSHIFNPPVPLGVKPILIPVEIMGIFTKPFALIIRLFANMISGHVIILAFICLIFIFGAMNTALGWGTSPFFMLLAVFIYVIEILVAFLQAYIFANLTAVFIGQAFEGGHDHLDHNGHDEPAVI